MHKTSSTLPQTDLLVWEDRPQNEDRLREVNGGRAQRRRSPAPSE